MVTNYRKGAVGTLRKNPAGVTLIAQLVDEDPATYRQPLMALARGGRAQTDQG